MGLGFVDRSFRYVRVNDTLATLNGATHSRPPSQSVAEVLPALWPEIEPRTSPGYRRNRPQGQNHWENGRLAQRRYFPTTFYPLRNGADITGIGVLVNGITERKQAQRGDVIIDATGVMALVNRQAEASSVAHRSNQRESATHAGRTHL
jgi:hypothetical protein